MPVSWILVPLSSALLGWLVIRLAGWALFYPATPRKVLGIRLEGLVPKKRKQLVDELVGVLGSELLSFRKLAESAGAGQQALMPEVDTHIDHFLKVRLPEQMPVISMFVGERTIAELKALFMAELELLFPVVMGGYLDKLEAGTDLKKLLADKLSGPVGDQLEAAVRAGLKGPLNRAAALAALLGLLIGLLQLWVVLAG